MSKYYRVSEMNEDRRSASPASVGSVLFPGRLNQPSARKTLREGDIVENLGEPELKPKTKQLVILNLLS